MIRSKLLLFSDWKIEGTIQPGLRKFIIVAGKHTSNWDYILMLMVTRRLGLKPKVLIKEQAFVPIIGSILKLFGGVPVDRAEPQKVVRNILTHANADSDFVLIITPEGTRSSTGELKSGFFRISDRANLPIVPATVHSIDKVVKLHRPIEANNKDEAVEALSELFVSSTGLR